MKSKALNSEVKMTQKEWNDVEKSLLDAGINKKELDEILGDFKARVGCSDTGNCIVDHTCGRLDNSITGNKRDDDCGGGYCLLVEKCKRYMVNNDPRGKLKDILGQKNIDIKTLNPAVRKLLGD